MAEHAHLRKALVTARHPAFSARLRALLDRNSRVAYLRALRAQRLINLLTLGRLVQQATLLVS